MKVTAAILLIILGFLTIQPAVGIHEKSAGMMCCGESCEMPDKAAQTVGHCEEDYEITICEEGYESDPFKEDCDNKGCNPFMSCPFGNFFMMATSHASVSFLITPVGTNLYKANDYLSTFLSECWHPPELI